MVIFGTIVLFGSCSWGSNNSSDDDEQTNEAKSAAEILSALGINQSTAASTTMTTALKNDAGAYQTVAVDTTEWQPLKTTYAVFNPRSEVFQAGIPVNSDYTTIF